MIKVENILNSLPEPAINNWPCAFTSEIIISQNIKQ